MSIEKYKLSNGKTLNVPLDKKESFFQALEKNNLTAELFVDDIQYEISNGKKINVPKNKEENFFKALEKNNLTATIIPGKSTAGEQDQYVNPLTSTDFPFLSETENIVSESQSEIDNQREWVPPTYDIAKRDEGKAVRMLTTQYSDWGFEFDQAIAGTDAVTIKANPKWRATKENPNPLFDPELDSKTIKIDAGFILGNKEGNIKIAAEMNEFMEERKVDMGSEIMKEISNVNVTDKEEENIKGNKLNEAYNQSEGWSETMATHEAEVEAWKIKSEQQLLDRSDNTSLLAGTRPVDQAPATPKKSEDTLRLEQLQSQYNEDKAMSKWLADNNQSFEGKQGEDLDKMKREIRDSEQYKETLKTVEAEEEENLQQTRKLQAIINDPNASSVDKKKAKEEIKKYNEKSTYVKDMFTKFGKIDLLEDKLLEEMDAGGNIFTGRLFTADVEQKQQRKIAKREKEALKKSTQLKLDKITTVSNTTNKIYDEMQILNKWFKDNDINKKISSLKNQNFTSQSQIDKAQSEIDKLVKEYQGKVNRHNFLKTKGGEYEELAKKLYGDLEKDEIKEEQLQAYMNAVNRNPGHITNFFTGIASGALDIAQNLVSFADMGFQAGEQVIQEIDDPMISAIYKTALVGTVAAGSVPAAIAGVVGAGLFGDYFVNESTGRKESIWDRMNDSIDSWQGENITNKMRKPQSFEDIKGFGDATEWAANMMATQIPNLAMMAYSGPASLYLMSASSAGAKYNELQNEVDEYYRTGGLYGRDYSFASMALNASISGAAEGLSERITLGAVNKTARFVKGAAKAKAVRIGFDNFLKKNVWTYNNFKNTGIEMFEEGFSEASAQIANNMSDILISQNKGWDEVYDGVAESFASGPVISGMIQFPRAYSALSAPFRSKDTNQQLGLIGQRMADISLKISQLDQTFTKNKRAKIEKLEEEYASLIHKSNSILEKDIKKVDPLNPKDRSELLKIHNENYQDRKAADEIGQDTDLTESERAEQLEQLRKNVESRNSTKENILNKYSDKVVETNYARQMEWIKNQTALVAKMGGIEVDVEQVNSDKFVDIAAKDEGQKSKAQVENLAMENESTMQALQDIVNDKDSSEVEKADAQDLINKANTNVNIAEDILSTKSDYGVMIPVFGKDGNLKKLRVVVNKDAALKDGRFSTGAHEFIHATFRNTLKGDPNAKRIIGQQVQKILDSEKITFKDKKAEQDFNDTLDMYDRNDRGEEKMALISEFIRDGRAKINDNLLQKLAGVFRRFSRVMLSTDIEFNSNKDILNFIRDYDYNIKKNRPSPAMARMLAKGANGKIFKDAKSKKQRDDESNFSKNVNRILRKNQDWDDSFDNFTRNADGSKKYPNRKDENGNDIPGSGKEDFQNSDDFWPAGMEIMNSKPLKNLIMAGVASETGIDSQQEMDDFVRQVLENIQDRYLGGLTKKARNEISNIEDRRAKGEITARETIEAIEAIENNKNNYKKGFDPAAANGSLFGWLTGRAGALGNSIVYTARGDVMNEYKKRGEGRTVSMEKQIGTEGGTIADVIPGTEDALMQSIDDKDMSPGQNTDAKESVRELIKIMEGLGFPKNVTDSIMLNIQEAKLNLDLSPKDVKRLLDDALQFQKKDKDGKPMFNKKGEPIMMTPKSEKDITPTGALFQVLNAVSTEFGIDPLRIIAGQDLNANQRVSAQEYIYSKSVNEDGSFNSTLLDILSKGETRSGEATGIANTKLGQFYVKGERVLTREGADPALGNKYEQKKRTNVSMTEFLSAFGINPDGSKIPGKQFDGIIRQLALEVSKGVAIQQLQADAITNGTASEAMIAKLSDGKSEAVWSKKNKKQQIKDLNNVNVVNTAEDATMLAEAVLEQSDLTAVEKNKIRPKLEGIIKRYSKNKPKFKEDYKVNLESTVEDRIAEELNEQNDLDLKKKLGLKDSIGLEFNSIKGLQKIQASVFRGVKKLAASSRSQVDVGRMMLTHGMNAFTGSGRIGDGSIITDPNNPTKYIKNPNQVKKDNRYKPFSTVAHFIANMNSIVDPNIKRTTLRDGTKGWIQESKVKNYKYEIWDGSKFVPTKITMLKESIDSGFKDVENKVTNLQKKDKNGKLMVDKSGKPIMMTRQEQRKQESEEAREVSKFFIEQQFEADGRELTPTLGALMMNMGSGMNSPMRKAAMLTTVVNNFNKIKAWHNKNSAKLKKVFGVNIPAFRYEHSISKAEINARIIDSLIKNNGKVLNNVWKGYEVNIMPGIWDEAQNRAGLKTRSADGTSRLLSLDTLGELTDMIVEFGPDALVNLQEFSSTQGDINNVNNIKKQVDSIKKLIKGFNPITEDKRKVQMGVVSESMKSKKIKRRGNSVFDFDETVGVSDNVVIATKDGVTKEIKSSEWPVVGEKLEAEGWSFDFSDFNKVTKGKPGPLLQKMKDRIKKFGAKDVFILTARSPQSEKAIHDWLKSEGVNIPRENVTGLGKSSGDAKALWMLEKYEEGYNDMYFADDATSNVEAVKFVLDQLDIKSKVVQAKMDNTKNTDTEFNDMLERSSGVDSKKTVSGAEARTKGKRKSRFEFFVPPSAEDFKGLIYKFLGRGKQGEADMKWFKEKLFDPFNTAYRNWNKYKQNISNEYKQLRKTFPAVAKSLNNIVPGTSFTVDTAIRTYLWNKSGFDIPGMDSATRDQLVEHVTNNPDLVNFSNTLGKITRAKEGYIKPEKFWTSQTIASDLNNVVNKVGRNQFMGEWIKNKNIIFSPENLNKIESIYGTDFREALEGTLYRMETGTNRTTGKNKQVNQFLDWINGSVGAVMFFNMRSAILQTISAVNFLNFEDNNIFKASKAFANQPQFWKDFSMLFNSDMLKQRRAGLQTDVSASELTKVFAEGGSKMQAITSYLLQKGFTPTQIADSFAIAIGGSTFYRNRVNKYIKEGMTQADADKQAMLDFQAIAEETQQSSRPDFISQQQAGPLGRIILAWANTPMQMTRLTKKALSDLVNGRGSAKANISKMMYYGVVQNIIFQTLQSGLAFLLFGDEEDQDDEDKARKERRVLNGALDSLLVGTGIYGAAVAAIKNAALEFHAQSKKGYGKQDFGKVTDRLIGFSPPLGTKVRKVNNAIKTWQYNKGVGKELGLRIENPTFSIIGNLIEAGTNIPIARIINKVNNLEEAITGNHKAWQRIALVSGWDKWSIGIKDEELEAAKISAKEKRKEEKKRISDQKKIDNQKIKEEEEKKEEEENKKKGIKTVRCSGINSSGKRCGLTTETDAKTWKCSHHAAFTDGMDRDGDGIKEYRCTGTTSSGKRCKNKTENKNKKCYAHQ